VLLGTVAILSVLHKDFLGGDTTTPSGQYARPCHAFLVTLGLDVQSVRLAAGRVDDAFKPVTPLTNGVI